MKNKKSFLSLLALTLLSLILLAGCGEKKWPMQITVVNRTTYPISDIRISLASDEDWGDNRIETTLDEGESVNIDLGEFTEAELTNEGFNIQFYGEDGEPVNPDYDPQNPTFFDNGDYLILAPPDISVSMFMDTGYDAAEYDQKIMGCYEQQDDGRGDLIPEEENESGDPIPENDAENGGPAPVLMGGGDHDGDQPENDYRLTEDDEPYPNGSGDEFYSWNSELYQRNVSEFEGVWYYDGDLSAETYIVIDGDGNWSYYQRAPGEAEAEEMDCGIFTYSTDEASTYYADSTMYDGVSIRVFEFDEDVLVWGDEGVYYLME